MRLDFLELLTLTLIIMKLFGVIMCSWWIVFAPMLLVYRAEENLSVNLA